MYLLLFKHGRKCLAKHFRGQPALLKCFAKHFSRSQSKGRVRLTTFLGIRKMEKALNESITRSDWNKKQDLAIIVVSYEYPKKHDTRDLQQNCGLFLFRDTIRELNALLIWAIRKHAIIGFFHCKKIKTVVIKSFEHSPPNRSYQ